MVFKKVPSGFSGDREPYVYIVVYLQNYWPDYGRIYSATVVGIWPYTRGDFARDFMCANILARPAHVYVPAGLFYPGLEVAAFILASIRHTHLSRTNVCGRSAEY